MKVRLLTILFFLSAQLLFAQHAMIGFGGNFIRQRGNILNVTDVAGGNTMHSLDSIHKTLHAPVFFFNVAIPFYKLNDENSLNFMFGLEAFASFSGKYKTYNQYAGLSNYGKASKMIMGAQIPLYICYAKGPHATIEADQKIGYMFGWGLVYSFYQIPTDKASFLSPAVVAEFRFAKSMAVRVEYLTKRHFTQYSTYTGVEPRLYTRFWQLSLSYNMPFGTPYKVRPIDKRIVKKKKKA